MIFKRRLKKLKLANGQKVKEGESLCFINSDGEHCAMDLFYDTKRKKFIFWNADYSPNDYKGLKKCDCKNVI